MREQFIPRPVLVPFPPRVMAGALRYARRPPFILALLLSTTAVAEPGAPSTDSAVDGSRLTLLQALEAAKDQPFIEPTGDIKAMLLRQNPSLAAPDCGVRYKQLAVAGGENTLTLLVVPQGRCRQEPGMLPQWVLQVGVAVQQ